MMHFYVDESGTHKGGSVLAVAGYLFTKRQAKRFNRLWGESRRAERLHYFRMSECAAGRGQFDGIPAERRLAVEKQLIGLIRESLTLGVAVVASEEEFNREAPAGWRTHYGSAYEACLVSCLVRIAEWAEDERYRGLISYFFESGHRYQKQVDERLRQSAQDAGNRSLLRYATHSFLAKSKLPALDAGDFLAWHVHKYFVDTFSVPLTQPHRRTIRKDFTALLTGQEDRYRLEYLSGERLRRHFASQKPPPGSEGASGAA